MKPRLVVGTACLCVLLAACSSTVERVSDPGTLRLLGFLQSSQVTRNEVEGRIGPPFAAYEDGRIATYPLKRQGNRLEPAPEGSNLRLVLVYRADGSVERWSLVNRPSR